MVKDEYRLSIRVKKDGLDPSPSFTYSGRGRGRPILGDLVGLCARWSLCTIVRRSLILGQRCGCGVARLVGVAGLGRFDLEGGEGNDGSLPT